MTTATDSWQLLAYQGRTVEAIKSHRAVHGIGLAEAKTAVEDWMAINMPPSPDYQNCRRIGRKVADVLDRHLDSTDTNLNYAINVLPDTPRSVVGLATMLYARLAVDRSALDLIVEVAMSDVTTNLRREVARKHIQDGVRMVWVIETDYPTVHVYTDELSHPLYHPGAVFDAGPVLLGFSCKVADLFA